MVAIVDSGAQPGHLWKECDGFGEGFPGLDIWTRMDLQAFQPVSCRLEFHRTTPHSGASCRRIAFDSFVEISDIVKETIPQA
jgi:hypothetical protein